MIRRCITCETVIDATKPDYVIRCGNCYRLHKSGTTPAPKPKMSSPLRDKVEQIGPRRPWPFGSQRELSDFLWSGELRAAAAEQAVMRLEAEVSDLLRLLSDAGLSPGKAGRLIEIVSRSELDDEPQITGVRNWLQTAKGAAEQHKPRDPKKWP